MQKKKHFRVVPKQRQQSEMTVAFRTPGKLAISGRNLCWLISGLILIVLVIRVSPHISEFKLNFNLEMSGSSEVEE